MGEQSQRLLSRILRRIAILAINRRRARSRGPQSVAARSEGGIGCTLRIEWYSTLSRSVAHASRGSPRFGDPQPSTAAPLATPQHSPKQAHVSARRSLLGSAVPRSLPNPIAPPPRRTQRIFRLRPEGQTPSTLAQHGTEITPGSSAVVLSGAIPHAHVQARRRQSAVHAGASMRCSLGAGHGALSTGSARRRALRRILCGTPYSQWYTAA